MADPTPQAVAAVRDVLVDHGVASPNYDTDTLATVIAGALTEIALPPSPTPDPELPGHDVANGAPPPDPTTPA